MWERDKSVSKKKYIVASYKRWAIAYCNCCALLETEKPEISFILKLNKKIDT